MTSALTGLYPWIRFKAAERATVWTAASYAARETARSRAARDVVRWSHFYRPESAIP